MHKKCRRIVLVASLTIFVSARSQAVSAGLDTSAFVAEQILSRPTDKSVTTTIIPKRILQIYYEYGTTRSVYPYRSDTVTSAANVPAVVVLSSLGADTRYYYRLRYKNVSESQYHSGDEHTFHTQRAKETTFSFTVEADPHPYDKKGSHSLWMRAMSNQLRDSGDFLLDLGDTFGDDHYPTTITSEDLRQLHLDCVPFFGSVCHSAPLFLCLGNHEGESGYYLLQTPPDNIAVNATRWRKYYYPNPVPDGFYSGNRTVEGFGIDTPENYYAWEWGDALFVVLDSYRGYTANAKPRGWEWTLGKDQYDWFRQTLETSKAKFKFVFAHHTLGETRGGIGTARLYEWGGFEADERTWGFAANRPGWPMPIHQLMVKNGVTIFFQGHDHLFAVEELDGLVYQEVPMPSDSTYIIGTRDNGDAYGGVKMDASGHLHVTVSPSGVRVEYVRAWFPADETASHHNLEVGYSYTVSPRATSVTGIRPIPSDLTLAQNFPNPFNPSTTIGYSIPAPGFVHLTVFDILGRSIAELVRKEQQAGAYEVVFDGHGAPSGMYIYQLSCNGKTIARKALLTK